MKFLIAFFILASTQAYSVEIVCDFEETFDFNDYVEKVGKLEGSVNENYSALERKMIFQALSLQPWLKIKTVQQAVNEFEGSNRNRDLDGAIQYINVKGQRLALVHYYPGDNEFGAYFKLKGSSKAEMIAEVGDSFITCLE